MVQLMNLFIELISSFHFCQGNIIVLFTLIGNINWQLIFVVVLFVCVQNLVDFIYKVKPLIVEAVFQLNMLNGFYNTIGHKNQ